MNLNDTRQLLAYISAGFDNRNVSEATAVIWADMLRDVRLTDAQQAVKAHFLRPAPRPYLDIAALLEGVRQITRANSGDVEADVRSAKARGLIGAEWPKRKPLPDSVQERLTAARQAFREWSAGIEARTELPAPQTGAQPIPLDGIGKTIPAGDDA